MTDTREQILARLVTIAAGIPDIVHAARNDIEPGDTHLPAIIVLEGDEQQNANAAHGGHKPSMTPVPVVMLPEICIIASETSPELGSTLNGFRAALIKAVMSDAPLAALSRTGGISYHGLISDYGLGRACLGRMSLRFAITYVLNPSKL